MVKLAVTGADGFVGRHVSRLAALQSLEVIGLTRIALEDNDPLNGSLVQVIDGDLAVNVPEFPPVDAVIHLAGIAAVGPSFDQPLLYINQNAAMMVNLCERLLGARDQTRLIVASTGAVYQPSEQRQSEGSPLGASSPYVVSKRTVETIAEYYRGRGLDVVVVRPFNHIGPGQRTGFIVPDLFQRLQRLGVDNKLRVGNLQTARDYTDVRDVAAAYLSLAAAAELGETTYNVASGVSHTGLEILSILSAAMGIEVPDTVMTQKRPSDVLKTTGDAKRLRNELGWSPYFDLGQSIEDFVADAKATN